MQKPLTEKFIIEKIKNLFSIESNWFLIVFLLASIIFVLWLYNILGHQLFIGTINKFFVWDYWSAISTITLIITAIFIAIQTKATKAAAVMPSIDITMRWTDAGNERPQKGTYFQFINKSRVPVFVRLKLILKVNEKKLAGSFKNVSWETMF